MINVRRATLLDASDLESLCRSYWEEAKHLPQTMGYNKETCVSSLCSILMDGDSLIFIAEDDGVAIGFIWLIVVSPFYSDDTYLNEQYLYIKPEYRKSTAFHRLLKSSILLAELLGCNFLQVGDVSENQELSPLLGKRYEKMGDIYRINIGK